MAGRSSTGRPEERSMIVDSIRRHRHRHRAPCATASPSSSRTCAAVVGLMRPKRLAEGAAMPPLPPAQRRRAAGRAPPDARDTQADGILAAGHASGTPGARLRISVSGPGQKSSASS